MTPDSKALTVVLRKIIGMKAIAAVCCDNKIINYFSKDKALARHHLQLVVEIVRGIGTTMRSCLPQENPLGDTDYL